MSAACGKVIWVTGLSGAGKTTVARHLQPALQAEGGPVILLDGDELRQVFPTGANYDRESRLQLALAYARLCNLLARQGATVICATISMRHEVHAWNRDNLPNYVEVFLDVPDNVRAGRDPKHHYAAVREGRLADFAGHDQAVDLPLAPHIHLRPGLNEKPAETARKIMARLPWRRSSSLER